MIESAGLAGAKPTVRTAWVSGATSRSLCATTRTGVVGVWTGGDHGGSGSRSRGDAPGFSSLHVRTRQAATNSVKQPQPPPRLQRGLSPKRQAACPRDCLVVVPMRPLLPAAAWGGTGIARMACRIRGPASGFLNFGELGSIGVIRYAYVRVIV